MAGTSPADDVADKSDRSSITDAITTPAEKDQPMVTPSDVQELFESSKIREQRLTAVSSQDEEEEEEVALSTEECSWRVEQLSRVVSTLRRLLDSGSTELEGIAQRIGDGCRDATWRLPVGQSGVLGFFLELMGRGGLQQAITIQTLRVIGNSCADTDENRARVVASNCMPGIVNLLNDDSILAFVVPVLFNTCVDYEPAQAAAYKAGINPELVTLISSPERASPQAYMNIICKLLALVANQEPEANFVHPATPFILLTLATSPQAPEDLEDFLGQTSVALTYLSNQTFQEAFLQTPSSVSLFLNAFSKSCVLLDLSTADPDEAAQLKKVKSIFTQALADLSASSLFATVSPIGGAEIQTLQDWIGSPYKELQSAACLALGNVARSDDVCIALVQQSAMHRSLVAILDDPANTDAQLLHSTLSFLKNLAIPIINRATLGEAGLLEAHILPRLWALDTQVQVQFTAVSLTRLLLVSSPDNAKRICAPLSGDRSSPAYKRTHLNTLINLFLRSDQEPTKTEAARAIAAVLRVLHSSPNVTTLLPVPSLPVSRDSSPASYTHSPASPPGGTISPPQKRLSVSTPSAIEAFYKNHDDIPKSLIYLGTQQKFPVLRSDLWFVMALMSRSPPGADVVATCLQHVELLRALLQTITGQDMLEGRELELATEGSSESANTGTTQTRDLIAGEEQDETGATIPGVPGLEPQQVDPARKAGMARIDRENGLVLIAELLQRCPEKLSVLPQERFREILKTGGEQVLKDRHGNSGQ